MEVNHDALVFLASVGIPAVVQVLKNSDPMFQGPENKAAVRALTASLALLAGGLAAYLGPPGEMGKWVALELGPLTQTVADALAIYLMATGVYKQLPKGKPHEP